MAFLCLDPARDPGGHEAEDPGDELWGGNQVYPLRVAETFRTSGGGRWDAGGDDAGPSIHDCGATSLCWEHRRQEHRGFSVAYFSQACDVSGRVGPISQVSPLRLRGTDLHEAAQLGLERGLSLGGRSGRLPSFSLCLCSGMEGSGFGQDGVVPFAVWPVYDAELARRLSRGGRWARPPLAKLRTPGDGGPGAGPIWHGNLSLPLVSEFHSLLGLRFLTPQMGQ